MTGATARLTGMVLSAQVHTYVTTCECLHLGLISTEFDQYHDTISFKERRKE